MTAGAACGMCGSQLLEGARFCPGCGSPVAESDSHAKAYLAREMARYGDRDEAIALMRVTADQLFREQPQLVWRVPATGVLVETLLDRGTASDVAEAEAAIERLAAAPAGDGLAMRDIWLLRLRALLARARGEGVNYLEFVNRYRDMATSLGFDGHIAWAEAMP
jgi:hypothetical protein